ncbi:hypothetical protein B5G00_16335 [Blautia sp. An46]|nr:transposase [Blautia sp. An46]OUN90414.1 hypothetical protein B5G00_16335 [Blautia sp. An46]
MAVAKDQIRQIITENNITSVADVYSLLKDSFKDILQELLEAEMDATLGYEKNCKGDLKSDNKRNGHSPKTLKSQYGEFLNILRWRSHPISWNRAMESVIESQSSDGGSHDPCRGSQ